MTCSADPASPECRTGAVKPSTRADKPQVYLVDRPHREYVQFTGNSRLARMRVLIGRSSRCRFYPSAIIFYEVLTFLRPFFLSIFVCISALVRCLFTWFSFLSPVRSDFIIACASRVCAVKKTTRRRQLKITPFTCTCTIYKIMDTQYFLEDLQRFRYYRR